MTITRLPDATELLSITDKDGDRLRIADFGSDIILMLQRPDCSPRSILLRKDDLTALASVLGDAFARSRC